MKIGYCKDCKHGQNKLQLFKGEKRICNNEDKITDYDEPDKNSDMLIYSYDESGYFKVGDNFGCIHFEAI